MVFRSSLPSSMTWVVRVCRLSTSRTTGINVDHSNQVEEYADAKPFSQIPGPSNILGFGMLWNLWSYLKNDRFYLRKPHLFMLKNKQQYGPIYAETIGSTRYIMATQPEDIAKTFKAEGTYPSRGPVYPWLCYREQRKKAKGVLIGYKLQYVVYVHKSYYVCSICKYSLHLYTESSVMV